MTFPESYKKLKNPLKDIYMIIGLFFDFMSTKKDDRESVDLPNNLTELITE